MPEIIVTEMTLHAKETWMRGFYTVMAFIALLGTVPSIRRKVCGERYSSLQAFQWPLLFAVAACYHLFFTRNHQMQMVSYFGFILCIYFAFMALIKFGR